MRLKTIDTHKAVKILIEAGAADALAEAMVNTFGSIPFEDLATKADLKDFVTKAHFDAVVANLATKADLKDFVTKAHFDAVVAKLVTRDELKAEMKILEQRLLIRLGAMMFAVAGALMTLESVLS